MFVREVLFLLFPIHTKRLEVQPMFRGMERKGKPVAPASYPPLACHAGALCCRVRVEQAHARA